MELLFRTGYPRADAALETIVSAFEAAFPTEHPRYVLLGSYTIGTAHEASDLDLIVIFPTNLSADGRTRADELIAQLPSGIQIDADIAVCSIDDCSPVWALCLAKGRTVFGAESIAPPMPSIEDYTAALIADVKSLMQGLRPGQKITAPLGPPNPALPLLGYEAKPLRGPDGVWRPSTKALSMIAFWGASALIALREGRVTASKDEVIELYRKVIGDEWTELLADVDRVCRREYSYAIPADEDGRERVRVLAERVLAFENYLLEALGL